MALKYFIPLISIISIVMIIYYSSMTNNSDNYKELQTNIPTASPCTIAVTSYPTTEITTTEPSIDDYISE
jgi:hypothetical protein